MPTQVSINDVPDHYGVTIWIPRAEGDGMNRGQIRGEVVDKAQEAADQLADLILGVGQ